MMAGNIKFLNNKADASLQAQNKTSLTGSAPEQGRNDSVAATAAEQQPATNIAPTQTRNEQA